MLLYEITVLIGEIVASGQALKFQEIMEGGFCTNMGQKIIVSSESLISFVFQDVLYSR